MNVQKVKFSIKDFVSKCDQIRSFQNLLKKSLMENLIFCAVIWLRNFMQKIRKNWWVFWWDFALRTDGRMTGQTDQQSQIRRSLLLAWVSNNWKYTRTEKITHISECSSKKQCYWEKLSEIRCFIYVTYFA